MLNHPYERLNPMFAWIFDVNVLKLISDLLPSVSVPSFEVKYGSDTLSTNGKFSRKSAI